MKRIFFKLRTLFLALVSCQTISAQTILTGSAFIEKATGMNTQQRDDFTAEAILSGSMPGFMTNFARIDVSYVVNSRDTINAYYFVAPDYLCVGTDLDFIRMPVQPKTAQRIADRLGCFLSTKKICDDVYQAATVKLEPYPMTKDRDSLYTFVEHNRIIEEQRQNRTGLIAGHKKDVIITPQILENEKTNRVALYGWHKLDGNPIQPVYTGHVDWYVDYSHGFRLVQRTIYVNDMPMDYIDVMKHPVYGKLICEEAICDYFAYPY